MSNNLYPMCETSTQPIALKRDYSSKSFLDLHKTFPVFTLIVKKTCTKCGIEKPLTEFHRRNSSRDGLRPNCKECKARSHKDLYERYKARDIVVTPEIKTCPGCETEKPGKNFYKTDNNLDGLSSYCKECVATGNKALYEKNVARENVVTPDFKNCSGCGIKKPGSCFGKAKGNRDGLTWECKECYSLRARSNNAKPETKTKNNARRREKRKTDPAYRFLKRLRGRIEAFLAGATKSANSMAMVGCSGEEVMSTLESLFWPGMTRANEGQTKWEVDHIIPLSSFDKTDPNWQFEAFNWSNMQPLWTDDNKTKTYRLNWSPIESKHELPERFKRLSKTYWNITGVK